MKKPLSAFVHVRQVPFNKLSKAAQRVAIAQDAIRQFEKGGGYCHNDKGDGVAFGLDYKDATERALAIFKNIVKNKGEFKP